MLFHGRKGVLESVQLVPGPDGVDEGSWRGGPRRLDAPTAMPSRWLKRRTMKFAMLWMTWSIWARTRTRIRTILLLALNTLGGWSSVHAAEDQTRNHGWWIQHARGQQLYLSLAGTGKNVEKLAKDNHQQWKLPKHFWRFEWLTLLINVYKNVCGNVKALSKIVKQRLVSRFEIKKVK